MRMSLVKAGILTPVELEILSLARKSKEPLWEVLLREGKITESWLADTLAQRLRVPLIVPGPSPSTRTPYIESRRAWPGCANVFPIGWRVTPSKLPSLTLRTSVRPGYRVLHGMQSEAAGGVALAGPGSYRQELFPSQAVNIIDQASDHPDIQIFPSPRTWIWTRRPR